MLSDKHAPDGDEGVCRTDTSGSVISAESFESAKGVEGAEGVVYERSSHVVLDKSLAVTVVDLR